VRKSTVKALHFRPKAPVLLVDFHASPICHDVIAYACPVYHSFICARCVAGVARLKRAQLYRPWWS
jgi:hypothetical protein